jgi:hypothetical protein
MSRERDLVVARRIEARRTAAESATKVWRAFSHCG